MLLITPVAIDIVRMLQPMLVDARRRNANLGHQLDRCSTSVVANICEGNAHQGAARKHKYTIALGEARETAAWLDMAEAKRVARRPAGIDAKLNHVIGVLVKLTR